MKTLLTVALMAVVAGGTGVAVAAPVTAGDDRQHPSTWAEPEYRDAAGERPSLTNQVGGPAGGGGTATGFGLILAGLALVVLVAGLSVRGHNREAAATRSPHGPSARPRPVPAGTGRRR